MENIDPVGLAFWIIMAALIVWAAAAVLRLVLETILDTDFHHDDTEDIL